MPRDQESNPQPRSETAERRPESERLREEDSPRLRERAERRRDTPLDDRSPIGEDGAVEETRVPPESGDGSAQ